MWLPASLVMAAAVAWRRGSPLAVAVVVTGADGVAGMLTGPPASVGVVVAWLAALYGLAVWTGRRAFMAGTAWTLATILLVGRSDEASAEDTQVWLLAATHARDFPGVPATGARVQVTGLDVFRFEGGRVVEHLHEADHEAMWEQLGVRLPPG